MSNGETDPFREETDLQSWATEMGLDYEVGAQGTEGQPFHEMSEERLDSYEGRILREMREVDGLPILPDRDELMLHISRTELDAMDADEQAIWQAKALEWLLDNPKASIGNLIDETK